MKTPEEFLTQMLDNFESRSGYRPAEDTDLSLRMRAVAQALHGLSYQAEWLYGQSFPQTAAGENLDRHAQMRGLTRTPARAAAGEIVFMREEPAGADLPIPKGTECSTGDGVRYVTTEAAVLRAGQTAVSAAAAAAEGGRLGNCLSGMVRHMSAPVPGIGSCIGGSFTGGTDAESDDLLRARVLSSYARLPNGANAAWYEARARDIPGVAAAAVFPRARGRGTVDVVVSAPDGLPGGALLAQVEKTLGEAREIAVDVAVRAPFPLVVDVALDIWPAPGREEDAAGVAESALRACFTGERLGRDVLPAELGHAVFATGAVKNYKFLSPVTDITALSGELPLLGQLSVTVVQ